MGSATAPEASFPHISIEDRGADDVARPLKLLADARFDGSDTSQSAFPERK